MKLGFAWGYFIAFVILLIVIAAIAINGGSGFIRYHFGDILIVVFIYCFVKSFVRNRMKWLAFAVFIFATLVEIGQYFGLVYLLGLGDVTAARIIIGTTFDPYDILMYFIGCALLYAYEAFFIGFDDSDKSAQGQ